MIPKIIHYCWFGGNVLPEEAVKCIESWKKYFPDYEIKEWNESNFDINIIPYTSEAYAAKKYAFVSDYARFWILYKHGGVYFDTDVEVIKSLDDIVSRGNFMGYECSSKEKVKNVAPGLGLGLNPGLGLGLNPGLGLVKKILEDYEHTHFCVDGKLLTTKTIVDFTTDVINSVGVKRFSDGIDIADDIYLYSPEYFCPLDHHTGVLKLTNNSRTIHHYTASWKTKGEKRKAYIIKVLGPTLTKLFVKVKHMFKSK